MRLVELEDVANGLYLLCLIIGLRLTDRLDSLAFWVFIARVGVVFLTNDVLFPVSYMPDQLGYIRCAMMYRGDVSEWCNIFGGSVTVGTASRIFAYFPMPFLVSVRSISLVNMALVIVFYAFLHKKGFFSPQSRLFYLCYPSFILYSAVGMRDVFILYLMLLALFFLFERKRFIVGVLFLYPLFLLKPQNAFMALPPFILALLAGDSKKRMVWAVLLGFVFTFGLLLGAGYLEELNKYRHTFFAEDGGVGQGELVLEEVHFVAGIVVVGARFQRTPVVLPQIAEIDLMAVVERHVHALVRETLVRDVLIAELELEEMFRVA